MFRALAWPPTRSAIDSGLFADDSAQAWTAIFALVHAPRYHITVGVTYIFSQSVCIAAQLRGIERISTTQLER